MERIKFKLLAAAVAFGSVFTGLSESKADIILTYTGNNFNSEFLGPAYTTSDFVTATFILSGPLGNNFPFSSVTPLSWNISDGVQSFSSSMSGDQLQVSNFSTDASGTISEWAILAHAQALPLTNFIVTFNCEGHPTCGSQHIDAGDHTDFQTNTFSTAAVLGSPGYWAAVPGPIAGTGLPGAMLAVGGFLG